MEAAAAASLISCIIELLNAKLLIFGIGWDGRISRLFMAAITLTAPALDSAGPATQMTAACPSARLTAIEAESVIRPERARRSRGAVAGSSACFIPHEAARPEAAISDQRSARSPPGIGQVILVDCKIPRCLASGVRYQWYPESRVHCAARLFSLSYKVRCKVMPVWLCLYLVFRDVGMSVGWIWITHNAHAHKYIMS